MRSRFGHCVIAFLLTAALLWWFHASVIRRSLQSVREEILAQEEYQRFRQYVDENDLDYRDISTLCLTEDMSEGTPTRSYLVTAIICAIVIIPYSILLGLIRRFAGRFSDSDTASGRASPPEEHFQ
jgi:hypothetical protein